MAGESKDLVDCRNVDIVDKFGEPGPEFLSMYSIPKGGRLTRALLSAAIVRHEFRENMGMASPGIGSTYAVALQYMWHMGYLSPADTLWLETAEDGALLAYCYGRAGQWNEKYTLRDVLFSTDV